MSDTVECCPNCGSSGIRNRVRQDCNYYCRDCKSGFETLDERPAQSHGVKPETLLNRIGGGADE